MKVHQTCPMCGRDSTVEVPDDRYERWVAGEMVQHVLPEWSAAEREQLMSGLHGDCFEALWSTDDA